MSNIKLVDKEHYREAVKKALELGGKSKESFIRSMKTIKMFANNRPGCTLTLGPDFVKHSFYFEIRHEPTNQRVMNGGMILHGFEKTYAVELDSSDYAHWSIHT